VTEVISASIIEEKAEGVWWLICFRQVESAAKELQKVQHPFNTRDLGLFPLRENRVGAKRLGNGVGLIVVHLLVDRFIQRVKLVEILLQVAHAEDDIRRNLLQFSLHLAKRRRGCTTRRIY
jgi:hypothetical protein